MRTKTLFLCAHHVVILFFSSGPDCSFELSTIIAISTHLQCRQKKKKNQKKMTYSCRIRSLKTFVEHTKDAYRKCITMVFPCVYVSYMLAVLYDASRSHGVNAVCCASQIQCKLSGNVPGTLFGKLSNKRTIFYFIVVFTQGCIIV